MNPKALRIAVSVVALLAAGAACAAGARLPAAVEDSTALPQEQQAGNVGYVTGGIGRAQSAAFQRARSRYPLAIEIYERVSGYNQHTADAQVKVLNEAGSAVLEAQTEGPFLLARVPPGTYRVEATLEGRTQSSKPVTVRGGGSTRAVLVFGEPEEQAPKRARR